MVVTTIGNDCNFFLFVFFCQSLLNNVMLIIWEKLILRIVSFTAVCEQVRDNHINKSQSFITAVKS